MGAAARRVPTRQVPDLLVRIAALRDPAVRQILPELGSPRKYRTKKRGGSSGGCRVPMKKRSLPPRKAWSGWVS